MGEDINKIYNFGCPVGDYILNLPDDLKWEDISGNYQEVCPISMLEFKEGDDTVR